MKSFSVAVVLAVLLVCSDARSKKGKLSTARFLRQAPHRDYQHYAQDNRQYARQYEPEVAEQPSAFKQPYPVQYKEEPIPVQQPIPAQQPQQAFDQSQGRSPQFQAQNLVNQVLRNQPAHSQLIGFRQSAPGFPQQQLSDIYSRQTPAAPTVPTSSLIGRLPDNSTLIRENIVDGFSCEGRIYGYYADVLNGCQIFHVCLPLRDVFKNDPALSTVKDVTYTFSFICNVQTRFSQDSLTCGWQHEVVPCELSEQLYDRVNMEFFKTTARPATTAYPKF